MTSPRGEGDIHPLKLLFLQKVKGERSGDERDAVSWTAAGSSADDLQGKRKKGKDENLTDLQIKPLKEKRCRRRQGAGLTTRCPHRHAADTAREQKKRGIEEDERSGERRAAGVRVEGRGGRETSGHADKSLQFVGLYEVNAGSRYGGFIALRTEITGLHSLSRPSHAESCLLQCSEIPAGHQPPMSPPAWCGAAPDETPPTRGTQREMGSSCPHFVYTQKPLKPSSCHRTQIHMRARARSKEFWPIGEFPTHLTQRCCFITFTGCLKRREERRASLLSFLDDTCPNARTQCNTSSLRTTLSLGQLAFACPPPLRGLYPLPLLS
ncbi:unnamed protein product [Pleuronectes platessa]|uniref:Uncharacterized protein n=1 Tax=Pleuronectes platessa TaxID=8262 RepID=A0A9N7ZCM3_PLEPL|nr:unnamed protein product [Pleuronectes platessa]